MPPQGPLQGIRILDLTRLLPGPLGTMLMADMGAEVIKIENPTQPDYIRNFPPYINGESANYLAYNRSKKSILLNYQTPEGQQLFMDLVKTPDVVVEQFRPGMMDKMGIGYETAKVHNPKIIYVSITGYGQTGPYSHFAGHDLNYIAYAGILNVTGEPNEAPKMPGVQLADIAGGSYMGAIATLAALHARTQTGVGQQVDVSMTDAVMPLLSVVYAQFAANNQPQVRGRMPLSGGAPNYNIYQCQDNKYVTLGTLEPKFWGKFCDTIGKPEWKMYMAPQNEEELADYKTRIGNFFFEKTQKEWEEFGKQHDLLISPINELIDLENDPQLIERQMIVETEHPTAGKLKNIGVPLKFSETAAKPAWAAPLLGEDTNEVFLELGISIEKMEELKEKKIIG